MSKEKSLNAYNAVAREYDTWPGKYARAGKSVHPFVLKELYTQPFASVLDVGCGTGSLLAMIGDEGACRRAGIDLSPEMIKVARDKLGDRIELRTGDSENLPWPECTFDVLTCCLSFHHYEHPVEALKEMQRVLKGDGRLIIGDLWAPFPVRGLMNLLMRFDPEGDIKVYSEKEMRGMLAVAGFRSVGWKSVTRWSSVATAVRNG
jgi:ubiquinone/menaquinone biosynthesis C-methylase UbiE